MSNVDLSILVNSVLGGDGYVVGRFGESIYDHPNRIELAGRHWKAHYEVHAYIIIFPFWNTQRL
jgi:hypothetical protein